MELTREEYAKLVKAHSRPSPLGKDLIWSFCTGGTICAFGQGLNQLYVSWGLSPEAAAPWVSLTLITLAALFTALGWFDLLARRAGAGTLVPITGFANAMVSPAMEFRSEGLITGTACSLFKVAGPVLVYGITASAIYGVILWALG